MRRILTRDELREVTGRSMRHTVIRELECMGVPFTVRSDGWPAVDEQAFDQAVGVRARRVARQAEAVLNLGQI